jgi:hypothetical protein
MSRPSLKLAGALFAGTLAGVAALTTLTSTSSNAQLSPASDSSAVTSPTVVESAAPCPTGTVERDDACVKTVTVTAPRVDDDVTEPAHAPAPVARVAPPAAPAAEPVEEQDTEEPDTEATSHDSEHEDDATESESETEHADSEDAGEESDD